LFAFREPLPRYDGGYALRMATRVPSSAPSLPARRRDREEAGMGSEARLARNFDTLPAR